MQASYTSVNTAEIKMREAVRYDLQNKTAEFLKSNAITVVGDRASAPDRALAFNRTIATAPSRLSVVAADKEAIESMVLRFSKVKMTSYEIAKVLRERGYKLRSSSVKRVAGSIGIYLRD
jgi:hypothetical protein